MSRDMHSISKAESKEIRAAIGKQCRFFLIYLPLFIGVALIGFLIVSVPYFFIAKSPQ